MGLFNKSKKKTKTIEGNEFFDDEHSFSPEEDKICEEASDLISKALRSAESGRAEEADKLFQKGIEKYQKNPGGAGLCSRDVWKFSS